MKAWYHVQPILLGLKWILLGFVKILCMLVAELLVLILIRNLVSFMYLITPNYSLIEEDTVRALWPPFTRFVWNVGLRGI
jgi:hypothetical protein